MGAGISTNGNCCPTRKSAGMGTEVEGGCPNLFILSLWNLFANDKVSGLCGMHKCRCLCHVIHQGRLSLSNGTSPKPRKGEGSVDSSLQGIPVLGNGVKVSLGLCLR